MRVARGENHSYFHATADNNSIKALSRNTHKRTALLTVSLTNPYNSRRKKLRTLTRGIICIRQAVANGENSRERSLSVMRYSHFLHFPTMSSISGAMKLCICSVILRLELESFRNCEGISMIFPKIVDAV